jgi:adenosylcobinamide-GDP ribazoletransferase
MTEPGMEPAAPVAPVPPRPLTDFLSAVGFLTVLPVGRSWPEGRPPRSVGWFAWVGWLLGGLVALPLWLLSRYTGQPDILRSVLYGAVAVAVWAGLTRLLHWDGLADTFDGIWGAPTPARRLEIMRDSHIGAFGTVVIVLVALVQVAAVTVAISRGQLWFLVAAPVIARFAVSLAAWELPAARRDGLGVTVMGRSRLYDRLVGGLAVLLLLVFLSSGLATRNFVIVTGFGIAGGMFVPYILSKQVGGMTGDLFGATVLLVETLVLVIGALAL